jgi:hypothetical protein
VVREKLENEKIEKLTIETEIQDLRHSVLLARKELTAARRKVEKSLTIQQLLQKEIDDAHLRSALTPEYPSETAGSSNDRQLRQLQLELETALKVRSEREFQLEAEKQRAVLAFRSAMSEVKLVLLNCTGFNRNL